MSVALCTFPVKIDLFQGQVVEGTDGLRYSDLVTHAYLPPPPLTLFPPPLMVGNEGGD